MQTRRTSWQAASDWLLSAIFLACLAGALWLVLALTGCAARPIRQPVTAKTRASIVAAQSATVQAQQAAQRTSEQINVAKTDVERVDAKDELIREWEARQAVKHHAPK